MNEISNRYARDMLQRELGEFKSELKSDLGELKSELKSELGGILVVGLFVGVVLVTAFLAAFVAYYK